MQFSQVTAHLFSNGHHPPPLTNILGACLTAKPSKKYSTTQKWFLKDIVLKLTSPSKNCKICKREKGLPKKRIMNESYNSIGV